MKNIKKSLNVLFVILVFSVILVGCNKTKVLSYISEDDFLRYWEESDSCDNVFGTGNAYIVNLPNGTIRYCMFEDVLDAQKNFEDTRDVFDEAKNNGNLKGDYSCDIREQRIRLEMRGVGSAYETKDCYVGEILINGKVYSETSDSTYLYGGVYLCGDIVIEAYTNSSSSEDQKVIQEFLKAFDYPIPEK